MHQLLDALPKGSLGGALVTPPLVVGLGSHHGDDQAGWLVLTRLQERGYPDARLVRLQHPADLLDVIDAEQFLEPPTVVPPLRRRDIRSAERPDYSRALVICDACVGGGPPGTIHCFRWPTDRLVYQRPSGSHDMSLGDVMELGRQLRCFPEAAQMWTVEAESWSGGSEPSAAVQSAAVRVADAIWKDCHDA